MDDVENRAQMMPLRENATCMDCYCNIVVVVDDVMLCCYFMPFFSFAFVPSGRRMDSGLAPRPDSLVHSLQFTTLFFYEH